MNSRAATEIQGIGRFKFHEGQLEEFGEPSADLKAKLAGNGVRLFTTFPSR